MTLWLKNLWSALDNLAQLFFVVVIVVVVVVVIVVVIVVVVIVSLATTHSKQSPNPYDSVICFSNLNIIGRFFVHYFALVENNFAQTFCSQ